MRHLLDLLDPGTLGTQPEPYPGSTVAKRKVDNIQSPVPDGPHGTLGTQQIERTSTGPSCVCITSLDDFAEAYRERIAICLANSIPYDEACHTAEAEIGLELARRFFRVVDLAGRIASNLAENP